MPPVLRLQYRALRSFSFHHEGKWNGGFAPYGYQLIDGKLIINEEEAVAIRTIFDQYVNTTIGANGLSKYLENHGIRKIPRQNGKNPLFDAGLCRSKSVV